MSKLIKILASHLATRKKRDGDKGGAWKSIAIILVVLALIMNAIGSGIISTGALLTDWATTRDSYSAGGYSIYRAGKAATPFDGNILSAIFGDGSGKDKAVRASLDGRTLEELIEKAEDEDVISDDTLKKMMLDRDSYKRLLQGIYKLNNTYEATTKSIEAERTYSTISTKMTEDGKEIIVREKHVEYETRKITVSTEDIEGGYKLDWQPILCAALQGLVANYGRLAGSGNGKGNAQGHSQPSDSDASSAEGGKIARYACQFIGNPYKWGGTSLTHGADCSGFTMSVYRHFGIPLPHSAALQSQKGEAVAVNASDLQPGDLIFYKRGGRVGHVAMYVENGQVVHASNKKDGIKVSRYNYRTPCGARRFLSGTASTSKGDDKDSSQQGYSGADKKLVGNDNPSKAWNYFKAKGLSDIAVAAICGNINQESGFNTRSASKTGAFRGMCQWDAGRWGRLQKKYPGEAAYDLLNQLDFAWSEMQKGGCRPKTLIWLSRAKQLEWLGESNKGAVWHFCYWYEGAVSDSKKYGIQEYDERLQFAKKWLKAFGGREGAVTDGKVFNAGDLGVTDDGIMYASPKPFGTYDPKTGLAHLSDGDINAILEGFRPRFDYEFDFVRDGRDSYSFEECKKMENRGRESDGGDPDSPEGESVWYVPASTLTSVQLPYMDVTYAGGSPSHYSFNESRWRNTLSAYVPYYDEDIFLRLVEGYPRGSDFKATYDYYKAMADGKLASSPADSSSISDAEGTYKSPSHIKASIDIPENAGGMSIPLLLQTDNRWRDVPFGGGNIASSGCSITSLAMVASYLTGKAIYPQDIARWTGNRYYVKGDGQAWAIIGAVASHYGLKCRQQAANPDAIRKALKDGKPVIVSTTGYGTTKEFTRKGHYIVLRGLTSSGKVLVNDPNDNSTTKMHYMKSYSAEFIVRECTQYGKIVKPMWVISK